jgi:hypothetical protein
MIELWEATLSGIDTNGFYGVQRSGQANSGGAQAGLTPDRLYHPYSFVARPRDPDDAGACQLFYQRAGTGEGFSWLANDPRDVGIIPPLKKGGSAWYCWTGAFQTFDGDTGTLTTYVPYDDNGTIKAHLITVGVDGNGTPIVEFASGTGLAVTLLDDTLTVKNASGSAYIVLDDSGTSIVGPFKAAGGADLGGPTSVTLVKHPPLATALALLNTALGTLAGIPALAAAQAQLTAAVAALTIVATPVGGTVTTKGA